MPYDPKDWGKSQEKQNTIILDLYFPNWFLQKINSKRNNGPHISKGFYN